VRLRTCVELTDFTIQAAVGEDVSSLSKEDVPT